MRGRLWFGVASAALLMAAMSPAALAQDVDQGNDASTQARFSAGAAVEGVIDPAGELDWFRMHVERGQRYSFTLTGTPDANGAALDPMLSLYDTQGNQLAFNDDSNGLDSALQYAPSVTGDIFVEARA